MRKQPNQNTDVLSFIILAGIFLGVMITIVRFLEWLIANYSGELQSLFFVMVLGGVIYLSFYLLLHLRKQKKYKQSIYYRIECDQKQIALNQEWAREALVHINQSYTKIRNDYRAISNPSESIENVVTQKLRKLSYHKDKLKQTLKKLHDDYLKLEDTRKEFKLLEYLMKHPLPALNEAVEDIHERTVLLSDQINFDYHLYREDLVDQLEAPPALYWSEDDMLS